MRSLLIVFVVACGAGKPPPTSPGSGSAPADPPDPPAAEVTQTKVSEPEVEAPKPLDDANPILNDFLVLWETVAQDCRE